eukprot:TRINITY_DN6346_c0_g1_i1.p2 TRINITY_DN6346_c0_g1~~TRINITY_DN6346_c0_g1_i1.p2  ORF type:complete len:153 (-),score=26.16 TRINITY_DN6346_c0_g1_i1:299-757(-)
MMSRFRPAVRCFFPPAGQTGSARWIATAANVHQMPSESAIPLSPGEIKANLSGHAIREAAGMTGLPSIAAYDEPWNATQTFEHVRESYLAAFLGNGQSTITEEVMAQAVAPDPQLPRRIEGQAAGGKHIGQRRAPRKRPSASSMERRANEDD